MRKEKDKKQYTRGAINNNKQQHITRKTEFKSKNKTLGKKTTRKKK
mgnify:FL=1